MRTVAANFWQKYLKNQIEELVKNPAVIDLYAKRIDAQSIELANYERIKKFTLLPKEFTQEGGEITPTMKIKRKIVAEKYREVTDAMYKD